MPPDAQKSKGVLFAELPGAKNASETWLSLTFANERVRREARTLLLAELSTAVAQGVALNIALMNAAENPTDPNQERSRSALAILATVTMPFLMFFFVIFIMPLYFIFSDQAADPLRVARIIAKKLKKDIERGQPLSYAMERSGYFSAQEVELVRVGEQTDNLATALRSVSQFQENDRNLKTVINYTSYPLLLLILVIPVVSFLLWKIIPRWVDIFEQLGAELPGVTISLIMFSNTFVAKFIFFMPLVFLLLLVPLLNILNGSRLSIIGVTFYSFITIIVFGLFLSVQTISNVHNGAAYVLGVFLASFFLSIGATYFVLPHVLSMIERIAVTVQQRISQWLSFVPWIRLASFRHSEAIWLGTLSMCIQAGFDPAAALRAAGRTVGGRIRTRTERAAKRADAGHPIGQACEEMAVLMPKTNARLRVIDQSPEYLRGLREIAIDHQTLFATKVEMTKRYSEAAVTILIGLLIAFITLSLYLPLFSIPKIVVSAG